MRVAIIGPVSSMEGLNDLYGKVDALLPDGTVAEIKTRDFDGDVAVLPQRVPEKHNWPGKRSKTGAARIKRDAKQRRRRKGK